MNRVLERTSAARVHRLAHLATSFTRQIQGRSVPRKQDPQVKHQKNQFSVCGGILVENKWMHLGRNIPLCKVLEERRQLAVATSATLAAFVRIHFEAHKASQRMTESDTTR